MQCENYYNNVNFAIETFEPIQMTEAIYKWGHTRRYNDFPNYIKKTYGSRVQKISINVGFSCPNRDGSKGTGGCIYCDNSSFKPGYCEPELSVTEQINKGIAFFEDKYPEMRYMAYFQSYTNTYAPVAHLQKLYNKALEHNKIIGLIVGTRPDCINREIVEMLADINKSYPVTIEFGVESTHNPTLEEINRCHTYNDTVEAIMLCAEYGIKTGVHLILGLPGESEQIMLDHARKISELPVHTIKLHQLQVTKNTILAKRYAENPEYVKLFAFSDFLPLIVKFVEILNPDIIIERFVSTVPHDKLIAPKWDRMKNFHVVAAIEKELERLNTWQGKYWRRNI